LLKAKKETKVSGRIEGKVLDGRTQTTAIIRGEKGRRTASGQKLTHRREREREKRRIEEYQSELYGPDVSGVFHANRFRRK